MPIGTEVLHVYATGLHGGLPHDLPSDRVAATVHLRELLDLSQMYADHTSPVDATPLAC